MRLINPFSSSDILNQQSIQRFIARYAREDNWHNLDPRKGNLGYGWIHYALIRNLQPNRVLCIGSRYGFIPAICALACRDNGKGVVDFVDAGYDQTDPKDNQDKIHWGGVGFWKKISKDKHFGDLASHISLHITTSKNFTSSSRGPWEYIHIDGDHSYNGASADFSYFWPKLKPGGFIVFHDIYTAKLGGLSYGVKRFWKEIVVDKRYNSITLPGTYGLGLIQK